MSDDGVTPRPSLAGLCPLCGAPLDLNSTACRRCGATPKRVGLCVHCKNTSSVRPHPELGWVCEVCGGARLAHPALEADDMVQNALGAATHDHRATRLMRAASVAAGVFSALSLVLMLLIGGVFGAASTATAAVAFVTLMLVLVTGVTFAKAKRSRARTSLDLEQAQTAALVKLLADFPDGAFASTLASSLQISHARAEQLLMRLNVRDDIQSMVADDGQLLFKIRNGDELTGDALAPAPRRLRLPTDGLPSSGTMPQRESELGETDEGQVQLQEPSKKEAR